MTLNFAGALPSRPVGGVAFGSFDHISSRPSARRVGTPVAVCRVGSGVIQRLYQAWMPGQYWIAAGAWQIGGANTELLVGSLSISLEPSSSPHVLPKSVDAQMPLR